MDVEFEVKIASPAQEKLFLNQKTLREIPALPAYLVNFDGGRAATSPSSWGDNLGWTTSDDVKNKAAALVGRFTKVPRLQAYEYTRLEKYGPQGWVYPLGSDEMIAKINAYYSACHNPCKIPPKAKRWFKNWLSEAQLTPYTPEETITRALEKTGLTSNSGTPAFTKRKTCIGQTLDLLPEVEAYQVKGRPQKYEPACVIGARSTKQKQRLIFMAPFSQNVIELGYVYALMDWLLANTPAVAGWRGQPYVEESLQSHFGGRVTHLSTDFTAMDTSVGPAQVAAFRDIFVEAFLPKYRDGFRGALNHISSEKVILGVLKTPGQANVSRNSDKLVYLTGEHGLFSGLGWTNLIETGLSLVLDQAFRSLYPVLGTQVNGDDGMKTIDGNRNHDKLAEAFASLAHSFGFTCNPYKQYVSNDEIRYLQRIYSPETEQRGKVLGAYPVVLTLNSIKNPERSAYLSEWQKAERILNISNNLTGHPELFDCAQMIVSGSPAIQNWLETGAGEEEMSAAFANSLSTGTLEGSNFSSEASFSELGIVKYLQRHASEFTAIPEW